MRDYKFSLLKNEALLSVGGVLGCAGEITSLKVPKKYECKYC